MPRFRHASPMASLARSCSAVGRTPLQAQTAPQSHAGPLTACASGAGLEVVWGDDEPASDAGPAVSSEGGLADVGVVAGRPQAALKAARAAAGTIDESQRDILWTY